MVRKIYQHQRGNRANEKLKISQSLEDFQNYLFRVVRGCHLGWDISQFGATSNQKALTLSIRKLGINLIPRVFFQKEEEFDGRDFPFCQQSCHVGNISFFTIYKSNRCWGFFRRGQQSAIFFKYFPSCLYVLFRPSV
jgi:hypothetical protein